MLFHIYKIPVPSLLPFTETTIGLAGQRAGALFFARHRDYFIVTRNFTDVYLDLVPSLSFIVTLGFAPIYRDWQKTRHRDADGT
jgi:hypothetical protein